MPEKYIDARTAARIFGCSFEAVRASIELGKREPSAPVQALIGHGAGDVYVIEAYQVREPHLSAFRRRLAAGDTAGQS